MRTTATTLGNLRLTTGQLVLSTLVLLGLMLPVAWALKAVNVMAKAAPALSGADAAAHRKEQGLDPALVAAVKRAHSRAAVTADCGLVEQQKLIDPDGIALDAFGFAVALDGDTAVVGSSQDDVGLAQDQGSALVFVRNGATWQQQAQLFASDGAAGDLFGRTVAISGNYIIIGAPKKNVLGAAERGEAYVFVRAGTAWTQQAQLWSSDGLSGDRFGWAVAISGDSIIVGAPGADISGHFNKGAVYRFKRAGTNWAQDAKFTAPDGHPGDHFGWAVALQGGVLLVGAPDAPINTNGSQGAAYIFTSVILVGEPVTLPPRKLIANDGTTGDRLGESVALNGSSALVGAPYDSGLRGSAYVFVPNGVFLNPPWVQQAKLTASQSAPGDGFGAAVAIRGDVAVIGQPRYASAGQGRVLVYTRNGTTWSQPSPLTASDGREGDQLGGAVAISGDTILAGAPLAGNSLANINGAAYVFRYNCGATPVVSVSAASFGGAELAPEAMIAAFGSNLTTSTQTAPAGMLPTQLAGASVRVKDSLGADRLAPLFFAAPSQINYQMPPGTATGAATITVTSGANPVAIGTATIASVAPSLFAANANGREVAAANALRVRANGTQQFEPVARYDTALSRFVAAPIDLSPEGDQVFLVLYGTGLRFRSALSAVTASIGGVTSEALFAGPAPGFVGLDQINLRLSRALIGRGEVDVALTVDGKAANTVRINIR